MTGKKKMKGSTKLLLIMGGVVLVVIVLAAILKGSGSGGLEVETEKAAKKTVIAKVSESGNIKPRTELKIAPDVSGEIVDLPVREGQVVKKGDLLVTIKPDNYKSAMNQANASYNAARANYMQAKAALGQARTTVLQDSIMAARNDALYKEGIISGIERDNTTFKLRVSRAQLQSSLESVDAAYYQMLSSQASLDQARQNLQKTSIHSAMDGTLTQLNVELGERVVGTIQMAGTEILRIADLSSMELVAEVNENDIVNIRLGDSANIEVDAFPDHLFKGKVTDIAYSATVQGLQTSDQITNFEVKVEILPSSYKNDKELMRGLRNNESPFRPGMSAQIDIFTQKAENVLAVPIQAVTTAKKEGEDELQEAVYVLEAGNIVKLKYVKTGISDDKYIVIKEGLSEGETIITGPYIALTQKLRDGMAVDVKKAEPKAGK